MKKRSVLAGWLCSYILIMMIPIVTVFVNYAWSMKVIRKEILEANNLVLDNLDYVINSSGANESYYMYGGMRVGIPDMIGYEEWVEALSGAYRGNFLFSRYFHYGTGENRLVYAQSIDNYSQYEDFTLFLGIPVSKLEELTKSLSEDAKLLMGIDGETALVLSNQGVEEAFPIGDMTVPGRPGAIW